MTFDRRIGAWNALYAGERRSVSMVRMDEPERPWPYPERIKERVSWALNSYRAARERTKWLLDDSVPYLAPYTGTEIFARAFGCSVHYSGDNMPFALPLVNSAEEAARLKTPDPEEALAQVFSIADQLHREEPEALLALPDIQSPLDVAALIWEKSDFYAAMLDEPEAVKELTDKVYTLLTGFLDLWKARYGRAFIAHYPDYYMPFGVTLSEDEVGVISPAMFDEFCLPGLNALSKRYGAIGVHCCADSEHQWERFKRVDHLVALNLVRPPEALERAYPVFRDACVQMHGVSCLSEGGESALPDSARGARLVLQAWVKTKEEALRALDAMRALEAKREAET